jgi:hypothetical protein
MNLIKTFQQQQLSLQQQQSQQGHQSEGGATTANTPGTPGRQSNAASSSNASSSSQQMPSLQQPPQTPSSSSKGYILDAAQDFVENIVEPPKFITSRHVGAVFEKLGYEADHGTTVFNILCATAQKMKQIEFKAQYRAMEGTTGGTAGAGAGPISAGGSLGIADLEKMYSGKSKQSFQSNCC